MIRFLVAMMILTGLCATAAAQEITMPVKASLFAGSTKTFIFTFAADRTASDSIDTHLGEFEIPSLPLPGDIFYVWTVAPTDEVIWISPMDVREYVIGESSLVEYDVHVNWSGGRLEFAFGTNPLPAQIDSMYMVDGYSEFPDNILSVKVEPGSTFETDNPAFEQFKLLVWFNGTTTSVEESPVFSDVALYPNPVSTTVTIDDLPGTPVEIQIVTGQGQLLDTFSSSASSCSIPVEALAPGMYAVRIVDAKGARVLPFIRQ